MTLRSTYSDSSGLNYRIKAAATLLGIAENTVKNYLDSSGIQVRRANEFDKKALAVRIFSPDNLFELARYRREKGFIKTPTNGPYFIAVDIVKGGTGKTTTACEIALHLQLAGLRVLAIDLDAQANLTQYFGYESDINYAEHEALGLTEEAVIGKTFAHIVSSFVGRSPPESFGSLIKMPFGVNGPHLIPADANLGDIEFALSSSKGTRELALKRLFKDSAKGLIPELNVSNYDIVVMDCPPNVTMTSTAALAASDIVVAPVRLDAFGVKGLGRLIDEIEVLRNYAPDEIIADLTILPTHFASSFSRIQRMQHALQKYQANMAPVAISLSEDFPKSLEHYIPLSLQKPLSNASKEYKQFTDFLLRKLISFEEQRT